MSELTLTKLNKRLLGVAEANYGLFQERQRLVYVLGLFLCDALRLGLGEALRTGQIDQIQLGKCVLLVGRGDRFALHSDREYAM